MAKIGKKELALIHIVKRELDLDDSRYRKILRESAGVKSAKELSPEGFKKLMNFFARSPYYQSRPGALTIRQKIFIKMLSQDLGWDSGHLSNFILKYYHKKNIDRLTKKEAIKLTESLKSIQKRAKRP